MATKKTLIAGALMTALILSGCSQASDAVEEPVPTVASVVNDMAGKWMVDGSGKPYIVPTEQYGEPVTTQLRDNEMGNCVEFGQHRVSPVTPQLVEDRFILFSEEDGPATVDAQTGMPRDYAQTPFGAALAAYNAISLFAVGDQLAVDSLHYLWDFDLPVDAEPQAEKNVTLFMPDAFRVTGCSSQTAQIQILLNSPVADWAVFTVPVVWESGQWIVRMKQEAMLTMTSTATDEEILWEEWTSWPLG